MSGREDKEPRFDLSCPIPISDYPQVLLAHGGGGRLMHQLIEKLIVPTFDNRLLDGRHDGAVFDVGGARVAFTTDSYVVKPLFFPGGDIGSLAVHGTVNDLAMCGARPVFLSTALILEEGLPMETLWRVVQSMRAAADAAGVKIVTGDTKVVDRGKGDGVFINTAGIGVLATDRPIAPDQVRPGDVVIVNGDLGRHGMAIMGAREGLEFESEIESDSASLAGLALGLIEDGVEVHCLRDLTRGGLASALNEIAEVAGVRVVLDETSIPVRDDVRAACEFLGLDPIYVANEGRCVAFVAERDAERAVQRMRDDPEGPGARIVGRVQKTDTPMVTLRTALGSSRMVDMLSGEQLPRIC